VKCNEGREVVTSPYTWEKGSHLPAGGSRKERKTYLADVCGDAAA